jgi:glutathione peroxidase-family protein
MVRVNQSPYDVWNFCKFLVDKDGAVVARYDPTKTPFQMIPEIQELTDRK